MPDTAEKIMAKFGLTSKDMPSLKDFSVEKEMSALKAGHKFEAGEALFERITPEKATELQQKYSGGK